MQRDYINGEQDDVVLFIGKEVERTPAYDMETLFVVGVHNVDILANLATRNLCKHIFCGANHSFNPNKDMLTNGKDLFDTVEPWDEMITGLLEKDFLVSLDFDVKDIQTVLEMRCNENDGFIPQVSVKMPYIQLLNYNAMLKIDDTDFKVSNPGVWCHRVHNLMDPDKFTSWKAYGNDKPL